MPKPCPSHQLSKPGFDGEWVRLEDLLTEYKELNVGNRYRPVAVGRFGIRAREDIYTKELAKDYSKNKVIHQNTLTVGMGSKQIDIGILTSEDRYSVSPAYHTYRIGEVDCDYLRYCLEARNADMFKRFAKRGTRQGKTIDLKRWLGYRIYLPSKERQVAVVRRLDAIERQIDDCKSMGQRLDDLVKSQFVEMFGELAPSVSLASICELFTDGDWIESKDQSIGGIRLLQTGNVGNGKFRNKGDKARYITGETFDRLQCKDVLAGDILISRLPDPVGRACAVPESLGRCITAVDCSILRLKPEWNVSFVVWFTRTADYENQIREYLTGTTRKRISRSNLGKIKIPAADSELQQQFADFVARVDKLAFNQSD